MRLGGVCANDEEVRGFAPIRRWLTVKLYKLQHLFLPLTVRSSRLFLLQLRITNMPLSINVDGHSSAPSERTRLLSSASNPHEAESAIHTDQIRAAEVASQGEGGAPQFPDLGKSRSHSQGQLIVPDADRASSDSLGDLVRFQENGRLEGIEGWKFRCVFGGILLGYFVSIHIILHFLGSLDKLN